MSTFITREYKEFKLIKETKYLSYPGAVKAVQTKYPRAYVPEYEHYLHRHHYIVITEYQGNLLILNTYLNLYPLKNKP